MRKKHLPNGLALETIEREYSTGLSHYSLSTIATLREFLARDLEPDVDSASAVLFPDEELEGKLAISVYFEGRNKRVAPDDDSLFPGRALELLSISDLPTLDPDAYEKFAITGLFADLAKKWFAECWWKAGGWDYKLPVEIETHDDFGDGSYIPLTEATG